MNERVSKLMEGINPKNYVICTEKGRLLTESYMDTERQPEVVRNAKAFANVLDNVHIFIEDGELIVGNAVSKPGGIELTCLAGPWPADELDALRTEGFIVSEEDEKEIEKMRTFWDRTRKARAEILNYDQKFWPFRLYGPNPTRQTRPEQESGGLGGFAGGGWAVQPELGFVLVDVDHEKVLHKGLNSIIAEAEEEIKNLSYGSPDALKKLFFLNAVIIAHKAIIGFAKRFSDLAADMAKAEPDPVRKKELEIMAQTCQWVPAHPARTFREAIQSFWFIYLMLNPSNVVALGRFDQRMYPFYLKDREAGLITDEEILELFELLRVKVMALSILGGKKLRERQAGMARWQNCTIGGVTPDGNDATNELSYLLLDAALDCRTPHFTITVRVHENTPEPLMLKALDVVKTGIGLPAFVGDKSYIDYLTSNNVLLEDARNYCLVGCLDTGIAGKSRCIYPMFNVGEAFQYTMNNGVHQPSGEQVGPRTGEFENFTTFADFMDAFKTQLAHFVRLTAETQNQMWASWPLFYPMPVYSSLMADAIKVGKDILDRQVPFENLLGLTPIGMINFADAMAAVKKLIFDDKKYTTRELKEALASNWQGNGYPEMRKAFLAAPKYGNGDPYVDTIARDLYQFWADTLTAIPTYVGGTFKPTGISITAHGPAGSITGATPDGRYAGEALADGTHSAVRGRDVNGPLALLRSAMTINQTPFQSSLLNMKFHPSALNTTEDLKKLSSMIKTYFSFGGKHIQFNVVSRDTLLNAQKQPDNHRDLIVRVAGFSTYFVRLTKTIQDDIITRTEYEKTA
jgi:pyruvate formate-lyase/glycerol dehydratase family glycyl radical enzyme